MDEQSSSNADKIERSRTHSWWTWADFARRRRSMSGLEYLRAQQSGEMPTAALASTIGWTIESVESGAITVAVRVEDHIVQGSGKLHGGAIAAVLDSALAWAVLSYLPAERTCVTSDLTIRYLKAVSADAETVRVHSRAIHVGRSTAVAEAEVVSKDGVIHVRASGGFQILERKDR
jgi:uncharacterized protein (TIGR00369 family)